MEKLKIMKEEIYEQKEYLDHLRLSQARTLFRVRTRTLKCKLNQSSDRRNMETLWRCQCGYMDSQSHILYCPLYQDLREGKDINSDVDIADYFKAVMRIRQEMDS